jgi:hypothetical protein
VAGAVPDGPERVGGAQGSRGQTGGGTRVLGQLGSHPGHRGKHQPGQTETGGGGQRPGDRRLQRGKAGGDKHAENEVGQRSHRQRGGQGGVAADHPGANQLQPATFLFTSGVPDDGEQAHQAGEGGGEAEDAPGREPAGGAEVEGRAV